MYNNVLVKYRLNHVKLYFSCNCDWNKYQRDVKIRILFCVSFTFTSEWSINFILAIAMYIKILTYTIGVYIYMYIFAICESLYCFVFVDWYSTWLTKWLICRGCATSIGLGMADIQKGEWLYHRQFLHWSTSNRVSLSNRQPHCCQHAVLQHSPCSYCSP